MRNRVWTPIWQFFVFAIVIFVDLLPPFSSAQPQPQPQYNGPISAKAFVDTPDVFDAAISPDGSQVVLARSHWESEARRTWDTIEIISANNPTQPRILINREDFMVNWIAWAKKDRLVASVIGISYQRRSYTLFNQIIAIDTNTGVEKILSSSPVRYFQTNYRPPRIISFGNDQSPEVLMSIQSGNSENLTKINVFTGAKQTIESGNADTVEWLVDENFRAQVRVDIEKKTSIQRFYARPPNSNSWSLIATQLPAQRREFEMIALNEEATKAYVLAQPNGEDRRAIWLFDLRTQAFEQKIAENEKYDLTGAYVTGRPRAYRGFYYYDNALRHHFADSEDQAGADEIQRVLGENRSWTIFDSANDGNIWLIFASGPRDAGSYWRYNFESKALTFVTNARYDLPADKLAAMQPIKWNASDGLELTGYLTMPNSIKAKMPLIVMPHGGPESRDILEFNPWVQFFAARGFMVFQPNFRGSDGFGRQFRESGRLQWGRRMRTDIEEGVENLIRQGNIDTSQIMIIGASYGGYATLNAVTQSDSRYACAISVSGLSDLASFLEFERTRRESAYRPEIYNFWKSLIGDPIRDANEIRQHSPFQNLSNLAVPLLLIHGKEDEIVPMNQSKMFYDAAMARNKNVELQIMDYVGHSGWSADTEVMALSNMSYFITKCQIAAETNSLTRPN
ncbi:MAG: peptidase S9 prolyl oligopeptidase [Hyphomonadaceae bacterium]|nr:MAG: peptidase S9 prolyl oligopeptidase [Hyphomonadaceae bacterium]